MNVAPFLERVAREIELRRSRLRFLAMLISDPKSVVNRRVLIIRYLTYLENGEN